MGQPLPARVSLAALAAALVAALLPLAAVACNGPEQVCINAEQHCNPCYTPSTLPAQGNLGDCSNYVCYSTGKSCSTKDASKYSVATCNIFKCDCDPCNACGPTHLSGGNPSCGSDYQPCKDVGGCDQKCKTNYPSYYLDGNCVACGDGGTRASDSVGLGANESCSDRAQFVLMPLAEKTARLSQVLCKFTPKSQNTTAGEALMNAIIAAADINGDKVLSCNEYGLLKWNQLPAGSPEAAALAAAKIKARKVTLPKPVCKLSATGKKALAVLLTLLKRPTRAVNY